VVGEGSRCDELRVQAASLGLLGRRPDGSIPPADDPQASELGRRVVFTGRRDDVPAVTAALDVAVLPSYREAQGLSILEAMALSRPVVASAVGGIPEMVEDGRSGLLVPPHAPEALAAAVVRLLTDHPLADTLGRAGRELVHERFCVELMVRAIESIYDEAVAEERRRIAG
jgi:glycosyltransferase involved in cell wall biosynthesis